MLMKKAPPTTTRIMTKCVTLMIALGRKRNKGSFRCRYHYQ